LVSCVGTVLMTHVIFWTYHFDGFSASFGNVYFHLYEDHSWVLNQQMQPTEFTLTGCLPFGLCQD
ncbi:MAG: hypothetical protein ACW987_20850, partial [Candidatus Thorarchaeota archaeon]